MSKGINLVNLGFEKFDEATGGVSVKIRRVRMSKKVK